MVLLLLSPILPSYHSIVSRTLSLVSADDADNIHESIAINIQRRTAMPINRLTPCKVVIIETVPIIQHGRRTRRPRSIGHPTLGSFVKGLMTDPPHGGEALAPGRAAWIREGADRLGCRPALDKDRYVRLQESFQSMQREIVALQVAAAARVCRRHGLVVVKSIVHLNLVEEGPDGRDQSQQQRPGYPVQPCWARIVSR